jgi:hypothetical protein
MLIQATAGEARAIIGAMATIAATHGAERVTPADRASLVAAHHYLLRQSERLDLAALPRPAPRELAPRCPAAPWRPRPPTC